MPSSPPRFTALVSGTVQGVGYRAFVRRHAIDLGLSGSAENLADGRVEVVAEGDEIGLERFLELLRQGPPHAQVRDVDVSWSQGGSVRGFHVY